jgi:AbrB family looped-hinge helix DNA binding protein
MRSGRPVNYNLIHTVIHLMEPTLQSTITARGQTVVPAAIRNQFQLGPADRLEWLLDNGNIRVVPVRANPIQAFRGQGKGGATTRLLAARKQDRAQE